MKRLLLFLLAASLAWGLSAQDLGELAARLDAEIAAEETMGAEPELAPAPPEVQDDTPEVQDNTVEELEKIAAESAEIAEEAQDQKEEKPKKRDIAGYFTNPAATEHNKALRIVEVGFDIKAGFGTGLIGVSEILKKDLVIDLDDKYDKIGKKGVGMGANLALHPFYVNVNVPKRGMGFGLFTNVDGRIDLTLPKELFGLLAKGNLSQHNQGGAFAVSGAVFAEAGLSWHGTLLEDKLRISAASAYYVPLIYVPKSNLAYKLETRDDGSLYVGVVGAMDLYTVLDNPSSIGGGGDLSLTGEYALFPIIDVGSTISHIPIVPAALTNGKKFTVTGDIINTPGLLKAGIGETKFGVEEGESIPSRMVVRPMRFDFYVLYRPLRKDVLTIKPSIGFTILNPSEETYFNGVLETQFHAGKFNAAMPGYIFNLYLNTGIEEGYWRHKLGFALNFRAVELDFEVGLKSQDYLKSYQASGVEFTFGMKFGW
ncbi:hypothetical protein AGMMS49940_17580 [Spirochaetia bacterium]|nr:hypothetical protein AGMMS49940_17580 [Spirochaetia bacterium]